MPEFPGKEMNQHSGDTLASQIEIPAQKQGITQNNHSRCRRQRVYMKHNTIRCLADNAHIYMRNTTQSYESHNTQSHRRRAGVADNAHTCNKTSYESESRRRSEVRSYRSTRCKSFHLHMCVNQWRIWKLLMVKQWRK